MEKPRERETAKMLIIEPQGGFPMRFEYGGRCGSQETPSIEFAQWEIRGGYWSAGCVLTHTQVDKLIAYLTKQRKRWIA